MGHNFQFKNLLGTVYRKGNLTFDADDNLYSPVGNRVTNFMLKRSQNETIQFESSCNITHIAITQNKSIMIVIDENGEVYIYSLYSGAIIQKYSFLHSINYLKISPDGKYMAIAKNNIVQFYCLPNCTEKQFNSLSLLYTYTKPQDDILCLDWSDRQNFVIAGSINSVVHFCSMIYYKNFGGTLSLTSNSTAIIGVYFLKNSLDAISISSNGVVNIWKCNIFLDDLIYDEQKNLDLQNNNLNDDIIDIDELHQDKELHGNISLLNYKKTKRFSYEKSNAMNSKVFAITCSFFNKEHSILVVGTNFGSIFIHEMPNFNFIQSLSMSEYPISSITINPTAEWIGVASSMLGQLLVWEWKSEAFILKQQGHFNNVTKLAYAPDGESIASGGIDGKVKLWNINNGICMVTFKEHSGPVTDIKYTSTGTAVVSSSEDGTIRAFDLIRYRNFRTFTTPEATQFSCLGLDKIGEFVCAGTSVSFEIMVWSMKTGKLLEILNGHSGPISSLHFDAYQNNIISVSWDKTLKVWEFLGNKTIKESIPLGTEGLASVLHPGGGVITVSTLNGYINLWDVKDYQFIASIDGSYDLEHGRGERDEITAKKSASSKSFTSLAFSPDGDWLLASGQSKYVCVYSYQEKLMLAKKFEISQNKSFDNMGDDRTLNRRKMTEFGNMALEEFEPNHNIMQDWGNQSQRSIINLPGVKKMGLDNTSRFFKPEINVTSINFSPSGRTFAAATTEGLLIYSLDSNERNQIFDPFLLNPDITPQMVEECLTSKDYAKALLMSLRLNEKSLIRRSIESIPINNVELIISSLPLFYVTKILAFIGKEIETSKNIEFYLEWTNLLLFTHCPVLKNKETYLKCLPILNQLQKSIGEKYDSLCEISNSNRYYFELARSISQNKASKTLTI